MLEEYPDVLTVAEVAQVLRVSRMLVYEKMRRGEIPSVKVGGRRITPKRAILKLLGEEEAPGGGERRREIEEALAGAQAALTERQQAARRQAEEVLRLRRELEALDRAPSRHE